MNPIPHLEEYKLRRERLMAAIGPDAVAIVAANSELPRNSDVDYRFRQDSDISYLTGFAEPDAVLVLAPGYSDGDSAIFVRPRDENLEQWNGRRLGKDRAPSVLGIDQAFNIDELDEQIIPYLTARKVVHMHFGLRPEFDARFFGWLKAVQSKRLPGPSNFTLLRDTLHELRLFKSDHEVDQMQRAAEISAKAHVRAMQFTHPGITEHRVETELLSEFYSNGARHTAYPSIVASGENACIMHYTDNNAILQDGDLLLIDAGCEIDQYASDITRTFPINGKYSSEQRAIYDVVLEAQLAAVEAAKPRNAFTEPHETSQKILAQGLVDLGILSGSLEEVLEKETFKPFTVHRCSHWLGLDVHDVGAMEQDGEARKFEPGMVITVEPGIYVSPELCNNGVDNKWSGIGIRVEDDVLITEEGRRVLTSGVPKQADEIEELMHG